MGSGPGIRSKPQHFEYPCTSVATIQCINVLHCMWWILFSPGFTLRTTIRIAIAHPFIFNSRTRLSYFASRTRALRTKVHDGHHPGVYESLFISQSTCAISTKRYVITLLVYMYKQSIFHTCITCLHTCMFKLDPWFIIYTTSTTPQCVIFGNIFQKCVV